MKAPSRRGNVLPPSRPGPNSLSLETFPGSPRPARLPALGSHKIFLAPSTWSSLLPSLLILYLQIPSALARLEASLQHLCHPSGALNGDLNVNEDNDNSGRETDSTTSLQATKPKNNASEPQLISPMKQKHTRPLSSVMHHCQCQTSREP